MARTPRSLPKDFDDGEDWQQLLETIDASEVPIEMLKSLKAHLTNGTSFIFPVKEWIEAGADIDEIDEAIIRWYKLKDKEILGTDFVIDLQKVKEEVIPQTKITLKDLK